MITIRGVNVNVTCWHMSACPNVVTHAGMQNKVQMVGIRGAESGFICCHMPAHVGTYQHMSACPQILTHASIQIRSK